MRTSRDGTCIEALLLTRTLRGSLNIAFLLITYYGCFNFVGNRSTSSSQYNAADVRVLDSRQITRALKRVLYACASVLQHLHSPREIFGILNNFTAAL